jgi:geranylgeranylglycerol-phosphate geranylgeranyltransferase
MFLQIILPASLSLAFLNGASNVLNQATDWKTDCYAKPYRPIPQGKISVQHALFISSLLYLMSLGLASIIHLTFFLFVLCITLFTITYSLPPRLKDRLIFNQLWIGLPRGLLGILASWSVFGNPFQPLPLIISSIAFLFLFGGCITKDVTDCDADRKTGTKTLINTYGMKKAGIMSFPFLFFPFLLIPLSIDAGWISVHFWLLTFLAIPGYYIFHLMMKDQTASKRFENTRAWTVMYLTYFTFASSFSLLTIVSMLM